MEGGNGRRLHITHVKLCLPFFSPLEWTVCIKKKRNHHADELDVDADVAKSRLVVTSAHVNSSINGTYGICREDFNSPNGSLNVYLS